MPHSDPVNWQPISEMPLIASMIDDALDDTRIHLETLTQARTQVHTEQLEFVDIYAQQISRWRTQRPSAGRVRELDRMEAQNRQLRTLTEQGPCAGSRTAAKTTLDIACNTLTYVFARLPLPTLDAGSRCGCGGSGRDACSAPARLFQASRACSGVGYFSCCIAFA